MPISRFRNPLADTTLSAPQASMAKAFPTFAIATALLLSLLPSLLACEQSRMPAALSSGDVLICEEPTCFGDQDVTNGFGGTLDQKHKFRCNNFAFFYAGDIPIQDLPPVKALLDQTAPSTNKWCVADSWIAQYE